jgi:outer membrane protein
MNCGSRIADCGFFQTGDRKPGTGNKSRDGVSGLRPSVSNLGQSAIRNPRSAIETLLRHCALTILVVTSFALIPLLSADTLTLDDAIRFALQKNQALKVSAFTPDIARANVLAEYGRFDPALTFRRSYSESETPGGGTPLVRALTQADDYSLSLGGLTPWGLSYSLLATADNQRGTANRFTDTYVTFGGISVTQPLLRGFGLGSNLAGLRIAKASRAIADWQYRQAVIETVTSVVLVYTSVLQARETVRISKLSRSLSAELVDQYRKRNAAGAIADSDVLLATARLASREENVLFALRNASDLENQLRQLIGETTFLVSGSTMELEPLVPAPPVTVDPANELKRAYELRPDFQAARLGLTRDRASQALAQNQLLPRVDFVGSYGYQGLDRDFSTARAQVRDRDARAYSAGIVVTVPLTFAEGRGRARAAKLGLKQAESDLVRLEQDIAIDIAAAGGQIETTRLRVEASRHAMQVAQRSLDSEQKKVDAGTGRTLDLLTAQEQLAQVQSSYARAVADERRARAIYERETGTTLQNRNIKLE